MSGSSWNLCLSSFSPAVEAPDSGAKAVLQKIECQSGTQEQKDNHQLHWQADRVARLGLIENPNNGNAGESDLASSGTRIAGMTVVALSRGRELHFLLLPPPGLRGPPLSPGLDCVWYCHFSHRRRQGREAWCRLCQKSRCPCCPRTAKRFRLDELGHLAGLTPIFFGSHFVDDAHRVCAQLGRHDPDTDQEEGCRALQQLALLIPAEEVHEASKKAAHCDQPNDRDDQAKKKKNQTMRVLSEHCDARFFFHIANDPLCQGG